MVGIIFDAAVALPLAFIFNRAHFGSSFILIFMILAFAPIVLGIWAIIKFWFVFVISTKRKLVNIFLADMHRNFMPAADNHADGNRYLTGVISNRDLPSKIR